MSKGRFVVGMSIVGMIAVAVVAMFLLPFLTRYCWGLIIPAIMPGIVQAGWIAPKISYAVAFWITFGPVCGLAIKFGM